MIVKIKSERDIPNVREIKPIEFEKSKVKTDKEQKAEFYKDFITSKVKDKKWLETQVINQLFKIPKNDLDKPSYKSPKKDSIHQIDTLFLPKDNKWAYCLCIVDIHSRLMDIEPLITRSSNAIVDAVIKIYKRKILNKPLQIICDAGKEFEGQFKIYCQENNIFIKALLTGKKIGIIDSKMKILSDALLKRQTAEELLTKKYNVRWVNDLKIILDLINEFTKQNYKPQTDFDEYEIDMHDNKKYDILEIGTKVRTALFSPVDIVKDKRLLFNFRSGDVRWSIATRIITNIILRPNSPIMYAVDNDNKTLYTREKIQVINKNAELPHSTIIKLKSDRDKYEKEFF